MSTSATAVGNVLPTGSRVLEYVVDQTLGGGGFGITYLAHDVNLKLAVALKEYLPASLATRFADGSIGPIGDSTREQFQWGLERFLDEARTLASFRHPNLVRVLRYFQANGTGYIVMEYESGQSLKEWLKSRGEIDRQTLLSLVDPLLDGLERVHASGFLHRDIKPDNIYVRTDGSPVLLDFGAARRASEGGDLTSIVTPGFAPAEQYHSHGKQGPWSDLYSLAAVMYWLISGTKPIESLARIREDKMTPASALDPGRRIGPSLLSAIDWALSPDERQRPQSVAQFRERLHNANDGTTVVIRTESQATRVGWTAADPMSFPPSGPSISEGTRKNLVCSILFLDIVEYSKVSVKEQYDLKSAFNQLLAQQLSHLPESSRIILDTGDGAAVCFMGDPGDVLQIGFNLRNTLAGQDRLRIRMGLHIGPVRILNDINGKSSVVGDGINVAQRVMSFAESNSLLVSRAFYEIVSCLSEEAGRAFRYLGERRDKHERPHELYSVMADRIDGLLGERTLALSPSTASRAGDQRIAPEDSDRIERHLARFLGPLAAVLVRRTLPRAGSADELKAQLAQAIDDPAQRALFLEGLASPGSSFRHSGVTSPSAISGIRTERVPDRSQPSWLTEDVLDFLQKQLAKAIGPMARVLVKNEARRAADLASLTTALAGHIEQPGLRSQFLQDVAPKK